ncbi:hypothetical protein G6F46_013847 [Rhizopus delemar]|nr:hypothetical protein G6F46_013847 [Rhizopus delemar]
MLADLGAGQAAQVDYRDQRVRIREEDAASMTAWWTGRVLFRDEALRDVADRFNQVRDNWGFLVEEHTTSKRQRLYARVYADLSDLLRVDPDHELGRLYWNYISYNSQGRPPYTAPEVPRGVPAWAFNQVQDLAQVRRFVDCSGRGWR